MAGLSPRILAVSIALLTTLILLSSGSALAQNAPADAEYPYQDLVLDDLTLEVQETYNQNGTLKLRVRVKGDQAIGHLPWKYPVTLQVNTENTTTRQTITLLPTQNYQTTTIFTLNYFQRQNTTHDVVIRADAHTNGGESAIFTGDYNVKGESLSGQDVQTAQIENVQVEQPFSENTFVSRYRASSPENASGQYEDPSIPMSGQAAANVTQFAHARQNNNIGATVQGGRVNETRMGTVTRGVSSSSVHTLIIRYDRTRL